MQFVTNILNIKTIIHTIIKMFIAYASLLTYGGSFCTLTHSYLLVTFYKDHSVVSASSKIKLVGRKWIVNNVTAAAAAAKSLQSCPTLCDPIDGSPPGSPVPGILQARTLEWVAISFSNAWKWKVKEKSLSRVWLLATPWTTAYQAPPSMGFSRQEYWSGVPSPSPKMWYRMQWNIIRP